jgi:hypothetical protein
LVRPEWVQRQEWALVARVLGMIVMVPKAQALARTEAAQLTEAARANYKAVRANHDRAP